MICEICKKEVIPLGLASHLTKHNILTIDYYNKFIKKDNDGICKVCGKNTKFYGILKGYAQYCSVTCHNKSKEFKEKTKETKLEKYGNENFVNVEKAKKTNRSRYNGVSDNVLIALTDRNIKIQLDNINKRITDFKLSIEFIRIENKEYVFKCLDCNNEFAIQPQLFRKRSLNHVKVCNICNPYLNRQKTIWDT